MLANAQQRFVIGSLVLLVFLLVASYFLAILLGPALFFLTPAGSDFSQTPVRPPILLLLMFAFYAPFQLNTGQLFMIVWGVFAVCFVLAWRLRERFHEAVGNVFSRPLSKIFSNWLFVMPIIACMLFSAVDLIIGVQDLVGIPTGAIPTPKTDTEFFELYTSLSYAPLIEEVGFRITPIGTFLLTYLFLKRRVKSTITMSSLQNVKLFFLSFIYPDRAKEIVGEKTVAVDGVLKGISGGEWIIVLITSITFGVAHIVSGIGWEVGKFTSTFVQGFVFAVVYLAYGFQAPILMHWFFNYYFYTYELSSRYYASTLGIITWIETITSIFGEFLLIMFMILGLKKILNHRKKMTQKPKAPSP